MAKYLLKTKQKQYLCMNWSKIEVKLFDDLIHLHLLVSFSLLNHKGTILIKNQISHDVITSQKPMTLSIQLQREF